MLFKCIHHLGEKLSGCRSTKNARFYIEERVLHGVFPFRIIDRTTGQCIERYESLDSARYNCRRLNKYGEIRIIET